ADQQVAVFIPFQSFLFWLFFFWLLFLFRLLVSAGLFVVFGWFLLVGFIILIDRWDRFAGVVFWHNLQHRARRVVVPLPDRIHVPTQRVGVERGIAGSCRGCGRAHPGGFTGFGSVDRVSVHGLCRPVILQCGAMTAEDSTQHPVRVAWRMHPRVQSQHVTDHGVRIAVANHATDVPGLGGN